MEFALSEEQQLIVDTARRFTAQELMPYEEEVEETGHVRKELVEQIRRRSIEAGIYAANMPAELGGGGLDSLTMTLVDRELGATSYALHYIVARPSNILRACVGDQVEEYLLPTIRGERVDCLAMSEPDAGSDVRGMKCTAVQDGDEFVVNGTKHFISHADLADYVILFAATAEEDSTRGSRKLITSFLVDLDAPGLTVSDGYQSVSNRGYHNSILFFDDCRIPAANLLVRCIKGSMSPTNGWALPGFRLQQSVWDGHDGRSKSPRIGRRPENSSARRSESSRACRSSSRTCRHSTRGRRCSLFGRPGRTTRER